MFRVKNKVLTLKSFIMDYQKNAESAIKISLYVGAVSTILGAVSGSWVFAIPAFISYSFALAIGLTLK